MRKAMREALDAAAKAQEVTTSDLVRRLIEEHLRSREVR
jgi:ribosomal protein S3AE